VSAAEALQAACAAGVKVAVDGEDLILEAAAPPSPVVLELLSRDKPKIVALLSPCKDGWTAGDWQSPVALDGAVGGRGRICPGHCAHVRARTARADRGASISTRWVAWVEEEIDEWIAARISSHRCA
jgi:hypothetical protein